MYGSVDRAFLWFISGIVRVHHQGSHYDSMEDSPQDEIMRRFHFDF